jgi:6-pyruvoyltetrahydropterin/6-carboxytetrahydropterin synthase
MSFISTKTYNHNIGLSCAFRQWRAKHSHCKYMHGYALSVRINFKGQLNDRNWVYDFGDLKFVKQFLQDTFDHKTVIAEDDPELETFKELDEKGLIQLVVIPHVGCEKFAEYICKNIAPQIVVNSNERVKLMSVEVREHSGNSAIYIND